VIESQGAEKFLQAILEKQDVEQKAQSKDSHVTAPLETDGRLKTPSPDPVAVEKLLSEL
jgi:hypothetical protein